MVSGGDAGVAAGALGIKSIQMAGNFDAAIVRLETTAGESHKALGLVSSGLLDMAGKRLCTQAQFEWRQVMAKMVLAVRGYRVRPGWDKHHTSTWWHPCGVQYQTEYQLNRHRETCDLWQFKEIAKALQPVCYQKGACGFMASMDRGCSIRSRVDANERIGRPSSEWAEEKTIGPADVVQLGMPTFPWVKQTPRGDFNFIPAIDPAEWAADPTAARHDGGGFVGEG